MKKLLCMLLCAVMLTSCSVMPAHNTDGASDDSVAKYRDFITENASADKIPDELVLASGEDASVYGVDVSALSDDGFITKASESEVIILAKTDAGLDRGVRDYVKYGNCADYTKTYGEGYRVKRLTIAGNDISEYVIVYDSDDYNETIALAASELAAYVEKTCGAVIPTYTDTEFGALEVKPDRTITITVDYPALGNESFRIEVDGDGNLTVYGGRVTGCIYGVYDLLEENVGWRFFRDVHLKGPEAKGTLEYLYEAEHIDLTDEINRTEEPLFDSRRMDNIYSGWYQPGGTTLNYDHKKKISENWYSGHGLNQVDYTGTNFEGSGANQPCLTDEDIVERIDEHVVKYVESRIDAGLVPGRDFYGLSLGQYDGLEGYCSCSSCMKVAAEEKSAAGLYVRTANRAAQLLKDMGYEELHVNILAYVDTSIAPKKTKPLDNVRIAFCFYLLGDGDVCNAHTIDGKDCMLPGDSYSSNKKLAERFEKWVEVCTPGTLDVWYYPFQSGNVITPAPMLLNVYHDIKYLKDHGVKAIINTVCGSASQFTTLIEYVLNEICWEFPESYEEFLDMIYEWLWLTYGDAAEPLYEFIMEYEALGKKVDCYTVFYDRTTPLVLIRRGDMIARLPYFCELFEEARRLADTEEQADRVELLEGGVLYLGVCLAYNEWYVNGTAEEKAFITEKYTRLHQLARKHSMWIRSGVIYNNIVYAPAELNLDENPIVWYTGSGDLDGFGNLLG